MSSSKKFTFKGTLRMVFIRVYSLRYSQSCWYFRPSLLNCCHSPLLFGGCDSLLHIHRNGPWTHFFKIWTCFVGVAARCSLQWLFGLLNFFKVHQTAITICSRLLHPTRSLRRIVCRGQERPKGSKDILRPDFQTNTWPRFFFKPMSPQEKGKDVQLA